ncbi:MAG TPA: pyridoxal phosphate-dependent aminotransferase [Terriglobales bacterium]|nr:pyridoxal phosphate-dependent aminotransferase [Terriglobales bacterium]
MFAARTRWKLTPNRYSAALDAARARGAKLLDLTVSNPTRCGFEFDSDSILASLANSKSLDYEPQPQGLFSAREAVTEYYNGNSPRAVNRISPEQIFLTVSTSEAYSYLFRLLCDPGDEVLVPRPSYPLFAFLADIQDVKLHAYDLFYDHGWHIDIAGIRNCISRRTRAVLIVNPNNPTGSFVHAGEMREIELICGERELALISDEVFLDYELEGRAEASAAFVRDCLSFALSGLSKISCMPQMKLAWIAVAGPQELQEQAKARLEVIADTYLSVNAPIQSAVQQLLGERNRMKPQLAARMRCNLEFLDDKLKVFSAIDRLRVEGGWYGVLRVPVRQSDEDLAIDLIDQQHVIVHPGHFYEFPQDGFLVLSLITPYKEFCEGVLRLLHALSS